MNLTTDPWIRVRDAEGITRLVGFDDINTPGLQLDYPLQDMRDGVLHFLIGVAQAVAAPEDDAEWAEVLRGRDLDWGAALDGHAEAFEVFGPGRRFMQVAPEQADWIQKSKGPLQADVAPRRMWAGFLGGASSGQSFDAPGPSRPLPFDMTMERSGKLRLDVPDALAYLLAFIFATDACKRMGRGTSRPGNANGPLWFFMHGSDLFECLWLNVLNRETMEGFWGHEEPPAFEWPWGKTQMSGSGEIHDLDYHPVAVYLHPTRDFYLPDPDEDGKIDMLWAAPVGQHDFNRLCVAGKARGYCAKWAGLWRHPMNAYCPDREAAVSGSTRHTWGDYIKTAFDARADARPEVVAALSRRRGYFDSSRVQVRCVGHDIRQGKRHGWVEHFIPLFAGPSRLAAELLMPEMVELVVKVGQAVRRCAVPFDPSLADEKSRAPKAELWERLAVETEAALSSYSADALGEHDTGREALDEVMGRFKRSLAQTALALFDETVGRREAASYVPEGGGAKIVHQYRRRLWLERQLRELCGWSYTRNEDPMTSFIMQRDNKREILSVARSWWRALHARPNGQRPEIRRARTLDDLRYVPAAIELEARLEEAVGRHFEEVNVGLLAKLLGELDPQGYRGKATLAQAMSRERDVTTRRFERLRATKDPERLWRPLLSALRMLEGRGVSGDDIILSALGWGEDTRKRWIRDYYTSQARALVREEEEGVREAEAS